MIGVAGGTASGKSTVCEKLMEKLGQNEMNNVEKQVVHLAQDSFYKELDEQEISKANKGMFNFDHPNAFDNELMERCLEVRMLVSQGCVFYDTYSGYHEREANTDSSLQFQNQLPGSGGVYNNLSLRRGVGGRHPGLLLPQAPQHVQHQAVRGHRR